MVKSVPGSSQTVQKADFRLEKSGLFEILRTKIGVTIVWDFGTRIYITLDTSFRGLCNDLKTASRAVTKALIGGEGWWILIYSRSARRISFEISCRYS